MTTEEQRAAFEAWYSDDGANPRAIERRGGTYTLGQAAHAWWAWQAATLAERERCAKVCEARFMGDMNREDMEARRCAAAIREVGCE